MLTFSGLKAILLTQGNISNLITQNICEIACLLFLIHNNNLPNFKRDMHFILCGDDTTVLFPEHNITRDVNHIQLNYFTLVLYKSVNSKYFEITHHLIYFNEAFRLPKNYH